MKKHQNLIGLIQRSFMALFLAMASLFIQIEVAGAAPNIEPILKTSVGATAGRWIEVSLARQRLNALENGKIVLTSPVSSGKARTPTVRGTYRIYVKLASTRMRGCCPAYDTPNVPWTMYFYSGYGIHGAYWHNSFGIPVSHGCVNLPVATARRLFNWASVGTKVVIY